MLVPQGASDVGVDQCVSLYNPDVCHMWSPAVEVCVFVCQRGAGSDWSRCSPHSHVKCGGGLVFMLTPPQPEGPAGASDADTCAPLTLRWFLGGSRSVAQVKDPQHLLLLLHV